MFKNYDYLGFVNPLYNMEINKKNFSHDINNLIKLSNESSIDPVSVIEFMNRFYFFGDRTISNKIKKTPWLAKPSTHCNNWNYADYSNKYLKISSQDEVKNRFLSFIEEEIISITKGKTNIGILLSGGMDSRVVAGVLKKLQKRGEIESEITALTWGIKNSRDVVYAKRIAEEFEWKIKHYEITPDLLKENITIAAKYGCEFSPVHVHALNKVKQEKKIDLILAGSYGDSVGRGEYSGVHVSRLKSIGKNIRNQFYFINNNYFIKYKKTVKDDLKGYYNIFPRHKKVLLYEYERQIHYMRNELNRAMSIVNESIPVFQVFTSPKTYNFMFNIPLKFRNDQNYYLILKEVAPNLLKLPWARTGKLFLDTKDYEMDKYSKEYHNYGIWIRNELSEYIKSKIFNSNLERTGIFNLRSIENALKINEQGTSEKINRIDEQIIWLASLSIFIQNNKSYISLSNFEDNSFKNKFNSNILAKLETKAYLKLKNFI